MIIFLLTIITLTIIPDAIIWNYISPPSNIGWKMLLCVPSLITWMSWFGFKANILSHDIGLRLFFGSLLLLSFPKLVFVVTAIPFGSLAGWMASIIVLMVIVYGFTYGWLRLSVKNETFEFIDLPPSFDGYKILQITDFHIGSFERHPKFIRKLVRIANEHKADLIVFTGDLINTKCKEAEPFVSILSNLDAPDGILSILGNHDYFDKQKVMETERNMGWEVLIDETHVIERAADRICIIGAKLTSAPPFKSRGNLKKALETVSEGEFKILLTHDPSHWRMEVVDKTDIRLTLSGHTHAGQIKIGRLSLARMIYREWGGKYSKGSQTLYVSYGLCGTIPFRMGAWPEINVLTLRKAKGQNCT